MALMQKGRIPVALELKGREPQTLYVHILVIGVLLQIVSSTACTLAISTHVHRIIN
jgi:hypothetical protein